MDSGGSRLLWPPGKLVGQANPYAHPETKKSGLPGNQGQTERPAPFPKLVLTKFD